MARRVLTKKGKAVQWEGLAELSDNINTLLEVVGGRQAGRIGKEVKNVLMGAALVVRDEARDLAPVRTGLLREAIFANYGDEQKPDVLVGVNHKMAPHSHLVEYGARGGEMPAQPFLRPAIAAARPAVAKIVADGLKKIISENLPS